MIFKRILDKQVVWCGFYMPVVAEPVGFRDKARSRPVTGDASEAFGSVVGIISITDCTLRFILSGRLHQEG
jgi:hypothetical protein